METESRRTKWRAAFTILVVGLLTVRCDSPVPGEVGGLIFVVRTTPAATGTDAATVRRIIITAKRAVVVHSETADGAQRQIVVDSERRTLALADEPDEQLLAQYQVPPGFVHQIRIFAEAVGLELDDSTSVALALPSPNLPSWEQSGLKVVPIDGKAWEIRKAQLTGVRALFAFDERVTLNNGRGYEIKPTVPAEEFAVNPTNGVGVFFDEVTVVFQADTSDADAIAAGVVIGATVSMYPNGSRAFRFKLPGSVNLVQALEHFASLPIVVAATPAVNYGLFDFAPNEGVQAAHTIANLPAAWELAGAADGGPVGDRAVTVAILDDGVDIAHPDLFLNIAINQGEIPADLRPRIVDTDNDGRISFVDLNDAQNIDAGVSPPDSNGNGYRDGEDLLLDPRWANGINEDADAGNTKTDDLVGWNFYPSDGGTNDPRPVVPTGGKLRASHGTEMAGVVGAIGNNGVGIAGVAWRVSIVPLRVTTARAGPLEEEAVPDLRFMDALRYLRATRVDVVNMSFGLELVTKGYDVKAACGDPLDLRKYQGPVNPVAMAGALDAGIAQLASFFTEGSDLPSSRAVFILAAGNSTLGVVDGGVTDVPAATLKGALPNNVIVVGATSSQLSSAPYSDYGEGFVTLWAPGAWTSLHPTANVDGGIGPSVGTSPAAASVSGIAALTLATHPLLRGDPASLVGRLHATSRRSVTVMVGACGIAEGAARLVDAATAVAP